MARRSLLGLSSLAAAALLAAGCGGSSGESSSTAGQTATAGQSTVPVPATADRLTTERYTTLAAGRAKLGGTTKACSGASFAAAGKCVAAQFVPILGRVNTYRRDLIAAKATVTGACADALGRSVTFQTAQAARVRGIIAQGRRTTTEAAFNRLNTLLVRNGNAAKANDAARKKSPERDWAAACQPAAT